MLLWRLHGNYENWDTLPLILLQDFVILCIEFLIVLRQNHKNSAFRNSIQYIRILKSVFHPLCVKIEVFLNHFFFSHHFNSFSRLSLYCLQFIFKSRVAKVNARLKVSKKRGCFNTSPFALIISLWAKPCAVSYRTTGLHSPEINASY